MATHGRSEPGLVVNPIALLHAFVTRRLDSETYGATVTITTLARKLPVTSMLVTYLYNVFLRPPVSKII